MEDFEPLSRNDLEFSNIAYLGTIYLLVLLASGRLRPKLRSVTGEFVSRLARQIRNPSGTPFEI